MSVTSEAPAADSAHPASPIPAASAAEHPDAGAAPLDAPSSGNTSVSTDPAPPQATGTDNLPAGTSHASSLPDEAQARAAPAEGSVTPSESASTSTNPFLETAPEPTPALPPRPEDPAPAEHTMTATTGPEAAAHTNAQEEQVSPQAAALRAMFPDFDVSVLQSVLDSVNGDQERAIDILLGMSDPEYVSTQVPHPPEQSSVDLDEQLARQLMLEDQREHQHATGTTWPRRDQTDVPYQARQAHGGQGRSPPAEERGGDFQELQRTMGQIAESGKRTFSSIVSKVKAKINEYEASRNTSGQSSNASTAPQWGAAPSGQLDRHTAQQAYQQHYYGSEPSPATEQPIALNGPSAPRAQVQGYDLDAPPAQRSAAPPVASPIPTPAASGPPLSPATSPRPSAGDTPRPPVTSSGSPVNAAKIGLLPKRPVSLLNANSPPASRPSDDDDELEYVENPFEERK